MTPRHVAQFEIPLDRLKAALGLPADARLVGIQYQAWWSGCLIQVEHPALPGVDGCAEPLLLTDWPADGPSIEVSDLVAGLDALAQEVDDLASPQDAGS